MRSHRRIFVVLVLPAFFALLFAGGASAAKLVTYPAQVHVAGGITITTQHDFTGPCEKGQAWTIEATADVEARGRMEMETYGQKTLAGRAIKTPRGAVTENTLSSYSETKLCEADAEGYLESEKPRCSSHTGSAVVSIGPDRRRKGPLRAALGIARVGGGEQDPSCEGLQSPFDPTPMGEFSALGSYYSELVIPLNITASEIANLKVGKKITRSIEIAGSCETGGVIATSSAYRDDTCRFEGAFTFEIKRLPGKGRGGFTTA